MGRMTLSERVVARYLAQVGYGTPRGWEHRQEKDEAVKVNIPLHLHGLWKKTQHMFKGTPANRAEQFMQYVHDHPGEDMAVLQDEADAQLAKMIREYERRPHHEEESDVPFA